MTNQEEAKVRRLRLKGLKAKDIATELNIPYATIRTYISRHPDIEGQQFCKHCGSPIPFADGRRRYVFCSPKCSQEWFNSQRGVSRGPVKKCKHCGKEFKSYGNKQYCSRDCYLNAIRKG